MAGRVRTRCRKPARESAPLNLDRLEFRMSIAVVDAMRRLLASKVHKHMQIHGLGASVEELCSVERDLVL